MEGLKPSRLSDQHVVRIKESGREVQGPIPWVQDPESAVCGLRVTQNVHLTCGHLLLPGLI